MKNIKVLEKVLDVVDVNIDDAIPYDYESYHTNIEAFIKKFKEENPIIIDKYLNENGLYDCCDFSDLILADILEILQGQIDEIKLAVKADLDKEYKRFLNNEKLLRK